MSTNGKEETIALVELAFHILSVNYSLEFADLRHLLRKSRTGDPPEAIATNDAMWQAIGDVALGKSPKHMRSG